jgi:hypothetical protein
MDLEEHFVTREVCSSSCSMGYLNNNSEPSKQRFCQHGSHPKISLTNFGGIVPHSARKQNIFKSYENDHNLTQAHTHI